MVTPGERLCARLAEVDRFERLPARVAEPETETHVAERSIRSVKFEGQREPGKNLDQDKPYAVGNKKPPVEHQYKKGQSGNLKGRPKGRAKDLAHLGDLVVKEFYKTVVANIGGKIVKISQAEILAQQMVKNAIKKGGASMKLPLKFIEEHEAREARREELKAKKAAEEPVEIDWDDEKEQLYQRVMNAVESDVQLSTPTNE
jgi:hypothetical protein